MKIHRFNLFGTIMDDTFWKKQTELNSKLGESINKDKILENISNIETKKEEKRPPSKRWKMINRHPDNFRKL